MRDSVALYDSVTVYDRSLLRSLADCEYTVCSDIWGLCAKGKQKIRVPSGELSRDLPGLKEKVGMDVGGGLLRGLGVLEEKRIGFIEELKGFLEKFYLMEVLDSRFDYYELDEDSIIKSNIMYTFTRSFAGSRSRLLEFVQGVVEGGEYYTDLDMFLGSLKRMLSWGNRRLYLWKIWGGFGISKKVGGSEKVTERVALYMLSRELLEERMFWLQEPRWGDRAEVRALLQVFYRGLNEAEILKV